MPRVCHFEIHVDDPDIAIAFYSEVLGWTFTKWPGPFEYWLIKTGEANEPGIDGGLIKRQGGAPLEGQAVNGYVCTATITDIDATIKKIQASGGDLCVPKMAIPGVGWLAYAKDPAGNIFGVMQNDPTAK